MFLIVGLGNPGEAYSNTRHNIGFMIIDQIAERLHLSLDNKRFDSFLAQSSLHQHKIILAKPQTYMNLSGTAVMKIAQYYKIPPTNIWIIHDELELEFGRVRVKLGGGSAGHNGIKSIDQAIGNNYHRVRFGIGKPTNSHIEVADYVLSKFKQEENDIIKPRLMAIADNFHFLLSGETNKFFNQIKQENN